MAEPKTFTKTITKSLDDAAAAKLGRELCQLLEEIEVAQNYRKEFNADMKEKLGTLGGKAKEAKAAIEAGKVEEHVECYEVEDFETSSVKTIRKDNGEVVDTRAMSAEERRKAMQVELPLTADGGGPDTRPDAQVISLTQHSHEEDGEYHEKCSACWATKERPPAEPIDDATALAESVGPGNELPPPEPSDEEIDAAVDANEAEDGENDPEHLGEVEEVEEDSAS